MGLAELIPDEAYYWNYARHMEFSFLDHPPMVAWLIWLGTQIGSNNEFGVRIGAFISGILTIGYLYALTKNLYDQSTAIRAALLLAILPFFFATGLLMTPDAPLVAAWSATLYYLERALLAQNRFAWIGVGIAFGFGILSKYTFGLVGISALVFVLLDPVSRQWLKRPHPYLAIFIALVLFSPVIIWNVQNGWISFRFQSDRLIGEAYQFSVHYLLFYMVILLTPVGLYSVFIALFTNVHDQDQGQNHRREIFIKVFTGVPLLIFLIVSTFDLPKFHWTGPVFLSVLPKIASMIDPINFSNTTTKRLQQYWKGTVILLISFYALTLHHLSIGIPGILHPIYSEHYFWREAALEIENISQKIQNLTGKSPIVVGMSKWSVASALTFYNQGNPSMDIRSQNMFGESAVMYDYWHPDYSQPVDRPIIQVGMKSAHLEHNKSGKYYKEMLIQPDSIEKLEIRRNGIPVRDVYYRVSQGFVGLK